VHVSTCPLLVNLDKNETNNFSLRLDLKMNLCVAKIRIRNNDEFSIVGDRLSSRLLVRRHLVRSQAARGERLLANEAKKLHLA